MIHEISMPQHLVLIGGGHSHAIVLKMFGMKPLSGVHLTLITDVLYAPYSGMLPGHIAGFYSYDECHIDLRSLCEFTQCEILVDRAIAIDFNKNQVICQNSPPVSFDLLSIDIGSTPATLSVPGANEYAIPAKPVPEFLANWNQLITSPANYLNQPLNIAIVGGGAGGVELALNMQSRLARKTDNYQINLVHSGAELMPQHNQRVRHRLKKIIINSGIKLHLMEKVVGIKNTKIIDKNKSSECHIPNYEIACESGLRLDVNRIFWVTQASAANWIKTSGLATDSNGFIQVNDYLQSVSHPHVFTAGDICTMINYPRPKAGVFAVRQGPPLFENLQRFLLAKPLKPFAPQAQYLGLIGTGNKKAIASRGSWMWESRLLWYWKDWIDRQFMQKFKHKN